MRVRLIADIDSDYCPECRCITHTVDNRAVAHVACGTVLCSGTCSDAHARNCRTAWAIEEETFNLSTIEEVTA